MKAYTTVRGGLPITVEYTISAADPSVGYMSDAIEDWEIVEVGGRKVKGGAQWLVNRLTKADTDRVEQAIWDAVESAANDFDEPY